MIKLSKTYNFGGKEYDKLDLNLDELTGTDLLQCEKEFKMRCKDRAAVKELEDAWAVTVAAYALKVKYGDLLTLKAPDYLKVVNQTRLFLSSGWEDEKKKSVEKEETTTV